MNTGQHPSSPESRPPRTAGGPGRRAFLQGQPFGDPGWWLATAAFLGGLAVVLGAFGAHGLKGHIEPEALETFETGVRYQMWHALALLGIALSAIRGGFVSILLPVACCCFLAGITLFSGSLYAHVLAGWRWVLPVTPVGGVSMICGWICLVLAALNPAIRNRDSSR